MKRFRVKTLAFAIIFAFLTLICMTGVSSAVVYHPNEVISTDTTWAADVHVINGSVTVIDNVKLTIPAGTLVKFNSGAYMNVYGTLNAVGTPSNKIVFTSLKASPSPGDWGYIRFSGNIGNDGIGIFEHCIVRYGGGSGTYPANIYPRDSDSFSFTNSVCEHSGGNGIHCVQTSPTITNSIFNNNNNHGLYCSAGSLTITNNTFTNNADYAAFLSNVAITSSRNNSGSGNGKNGLGISCTVTTNQAWETSFPYIIDRLTVIDDCELTLEPGVVVKFNSSASMTVLGTLNATGTPDKKIVFTSLKDDSYGGDTNNDGNVTSSLPGDWGIISFQGQISYDGIGIFEHCIVRYGGGSGTYPANIYPRDSDSFSFTNSVCEHSGGNGIHCVQTSPTITNSIFNNNSIHGLYCSHGSLTITNNRFTNNTDYAAYFSSISSPVGTITSSRNNSGSGNGKNGLGISCTVTTNQAWETSFPYIIDRLTVIDDCELTLEPGVVVKFNSSASMTVLGTLNATGTPDKKIVFTSLKDDSYGGDTNNDGNVTSSLPGDWGIISFQGNIGNDGIGIFEHCIVRYGGGSGTYPANIYPRDSDSFSFTNSVCEHSGGNGIHCVQTSPTITNSIFNNNSIHGLYCSHGSLTITNNRFTNNTDYAAYFSSISSPVGTITSSRNNSGSGNGKNGLGISCTVTTNQAWETSFPYIIDRLTVIDDCELTLEPGVVVKFNSSASMTVLGTLNATGTPDKKIVFTSLKDDSYGGDTNNDGDVTSPLPGDWGIISFQGQISYDGIGIFEHCIVRYGGGSGTYPANIYPGDSDSFSFRNSVCEYSEGNGIFCVQTSPTITNSIFNNNSIHGLSSSYGSITATDSTFINNTGSGIYLSSANSGKIISNTITNNTVYGIYLSTSSNNLIYNNYFNNTNNAFDNGNNVWNVTKTAGTNIIGGAYLGGNYWSDYAGKDETGDGLGDTLLPYNVGITSGGDWHPLVRVPASHLSFTQHAPPSSNVATGTPNVLVNTLDFTATGENILVDKINITLYGTGSSADLWDIKIYKETGGDGFDPTTDLFISDSETLDSCSGSVCTVTLGTGGSNAPQTIAAGDTTWYIVFDIASTATTGNTVGGKIASGVDISAKVDGETIVAQKVGDDPTEVRTIAGSGLIYDFIITEHFVISYSTTWGFTPVDDKDEDPENGIPDYVDNIGEVMEEAYDLYVDTWHFDKGETDPDKLDVDAPDDISGDVKKYVEEGRYYVRIGTYMPSALYGIGGSPYTHIKLKHDMAVTKGTCFHEYFHAIQNVYRPFMWFRHVRHINSAGWIIEGTAEAMDTIAPDFPAMYTFDTNPSFIEEYLKHSYSRITRRESAYNAELYWLFIADKTKIDFGGIDAIKNVWIELIAHGWDDDMNAVNDMLADSPAGYTFDQSFMAFAKANYFAESFYTPQVAVIIDLYRNSDEFIKTVNLRNEKKVRYHTLGIDPNIKPIQSYGVHYFEIQAPPGKVVKVTLDRCWPSQICFFVMEYKKGEEGQEYILLNTPNYENILGKGDADGTVYIIGRLDDSGIGDFEITFEDVTPSTPTTTDSTILPTQQIPITATLDPTTEATFELFWQGSTLNLTLLTPEDVLIDPSTTDPDITHVKNATYEYYTIQNPQPGDWTMNILAVDVPPEGENFTAVVYVATNLTLSLDTDRYRYDPGEYVSIHASLTNNSTPVTGASVQAEVQRPDGSENITLFDDGTHGDAQANDGVYSNTYTDTSAGGTYTIKATACGTIDGCPFVRERQTSVLVQLAPDLIVADITFSNNAPSSGDEITINASIQNIGGVNASSFSVEFYDGDPYVDGTYIGSETITTDLIVGEAVNVATSWTAKSGSHNIFVRVLPLALEINESNNIANRTVYVTPIYNLSIIAAGTDKSIYAPNENVTIYCIVENADHDLFSPDMVYAEIKNHTFNLSEYSTGYYMGIFNQTSQAGTYNVTIYANKTGYENDTARLSFGVEGADTTPPTIIIVSPANNTTYPTKSVNLNYTVNEPTVWVGYSLDGADNVTLDGNTTLTNLSDGAHTVTVYVTDTAGNKNSSTVWFTIDTTPPASITNVLHASGQTWINWTWTNPSDPDFNHTEVWIDSWFKLNVAIPEHTYNATGLSPNTTHEIGTRTVDVSGNVNQTWVNDTAKTLLAHNNTPPIITNVTATNITTNSVTITWDTNELSDSLVNYGTESGNYTVQNYNSTNVTSHTVNLTELLLNTTYYYLVNSTDASGNTNESVEYNFTTAVISDTTPPETVSNLGEIDKGSSWILWNWTSPPDPDFNHTEVRIDGEFKVNVITPEHTYNATGLSANTTHEIGTRTIDLSGNINQTWVNDTAKTLLAHDITPPTITNVTATNITTNSVTITWDTNELSDSLVKYGTESGNYTVQKYDLTNVTSHTINLTELLSNTIYYYLVNSTDARGNANESVEYNFTTAVISDTTPPETVSNLGEIGKGNSWILWNWTNPSEPDFNHTEVWIDDEFKVTVTTPEHTYNATGLSPKTTYEIGTRTVNVSGNVNLTWVNDTATTLIHDVNVSIDYAAATNGIKIKYNGTEIPASENLTIGDTYDIYYKIVNEGDYNETVNVSLLVANSTWTQTVDTHTWNIKIGSYRYSGGDSWDTRALTPGEYNITVNASISIDDNWLNNERIRAVTFALPSNQPPVSDPNGPYTGTEGVAILFNGSGSYDPDGSIYNYTWDFGDGNTGTGEKPTHTYTQNGTYTVTLNVTDNDGATDTNTTTATIADTEPTANFSGVPTIGFEPLTVNFTDNSASYDGITWMWDFGDGNTSTEQNPSHTYSAGTYTVNLTVTEGDCDSDTETKVNYINVTRVNQPPVSDPNGPYNGTEGEVIAFNGSRSYDSDGSIANYTWDFGDGNTGTGEKTTHTYAQNGTYTVSLNVTDNEGATDTKTTTATINDTEPIADFFATPTSGLESLTVDFTDTSTAYDTIVSWTWDFGDGNTSTERNPNNTYAAGIYTVNLTVTDADGDNDTETKVDYINVTRENQPPVADPNGPYEDTEGELIEFNGSLSYDSDGSIANYTWDFGDGNTGTGEKPTHTYAQNGTYNVTLNVTDDDGATDANTTTATIADTKPTANFSCTPTIGLEPLTVNFTDNSTSYDGITWAWDFGDGNTSTEQNPSHTYSAGTYTVNLTVTEGDCDSDTETKVDYINVTRVNQPPVSDPNGPYNGTEGEVIQFNGSGSYDPDGSIYNYTWDFGDGNTGTGEKPTHTYAQNGTYSVSLNVTDNDGATDANTTTATISDTEPTANFSCTPTIGLEPLTVNFTDNSTSYDGITWAWDFGEGNTSTEQNPSHTYSAGTYTVNLTVTEGDGDCDTETKVNYINVTRVNQPPVSDPNGPYNGMEGVAILFNGSGSYDSDGSIYNYTWDFGDGSTGTGVSPTHTYTQNATYSVTLNVTDDDGATDANTTTATIADTKPTANFSAMPTSGPEPLTVNFTDNSTSYDGITAWEWDFGNGNNSSEPNPTHEYTTDGTYTVSLTVHEADGDSDTETNEDYINVTRLNQPPVSDPNGPYAGTEGEAIAFVGTGSFDSDGTIIAYNWDFGDGNFSTGMNPKHTYAQDGTYTVTLNVTDNEGATDTNTTTATIADTRPTANFSGSPTTGLKPLTVNFIDNSTSYDGFSAWLWDFGDGNNSNEQNPTHEYANAGLYNVTLTVYEADGNSDTEAKVDYITVTDGIDVNQPPVAEANGAYTGVEGAPITYNGSGSYDPDGSIASYAWDFGDGNTGTGVSPDHTYAQEGTYTVTLVVNDGVLDSAPDATTATVNDTEPTADFNVLPTSGSEPLTVEFTDISSSYDGIASWSWEFGDGETSNEQNPTHTYMSSGTYTLALTVTEADDDTATKEDYITVTPAGDTIPPVIESVSLDAYTTIPDATIHVTVEATDNVGVTSVTADDIALVETGSIWEGDITAPSDTGDYTLTIRAEDAAENVAETAVDYSVVTPTGGLGVAILPKISSAPAGSTLLLDIKIVSTENFDDILHVYVTLDGIPPDYQADLSWFSWTDTTVQMPAGQEIVLPIEVDIPSGISGYKSFGVKAESTKWSSYAQDFGAVLVT